MQVSAAPFNGKVYENPVPTQMMQRGDFLKALKGYFTKPSDHKPRLPLGPFTVDYETLSGTPSFTPKITWLGHSTILIELEGIRILTDPVWYKRASPFTILGPKRFFEVPIPMNRLPHIDYILLSHDHYDHLDKHSIKQLASRKIPVITFLGVGDRLRKWGIPEEQIIQIGWWQDVHISELLTITGLPTRHFSGRWINDQFTTLWGSFAISGRQYRIYFGADSGYYEGFGLIGERYGPFDLTMLDTGAYNELWEQIHMGPVNAVQAHIDLKGKLLMPIHWGTFSLASHGWKEPVERLLQEAAERSVAVFLPAPGESAEAIHPYNSNWWKNYS